MPCYYTLKNDYDHIATLNVQGKCKASLVPKRHTVTVTEILTCMQATQVPAGNVWTSHTTYILLFVGMASEINIFPWETLKEKVGSEWSAVLDNIGF